jgi:quinol monooxygenase YgiN
MHTLIGRLTTHPGKRDELAAILLHAAELQAADPSCRQYAVFVSETDQDAVWISEAWDTKETHEATLQRSEVRRLVERGRPLLRGMPETIESLPEGVRALGGKQP